MFTTLKSWLRPTSRKCRRHRLGAIVEALEDRSVPNATYFALNSQSAGRFEQNWANTGLITTNNNWSGVPSMEGFSGAGLAASPGANPSNILTPGGSQIVTANQSNPDTLAPGGIAEFELSNPVVALAGDGTNQAPHLVAYLDTRGTGNIQVSYNVRDIDGSSRNSASQVSLQYRWGTTTGEIAGKNFTNIPAAFIADATTGSSTGSIAVSVPLPTDANDKPFVQLRWITADASGDDEWIGIDDIVVDGNMPPAISLASSTLNYIENDPLTFVDPGMVLSDPDSSDFNGGTLTVNYAAVPTGDDRLIVNNQGTAIGQISTSGTVSAGISVRYTTAGGTAPIASANPNGGEGTTPLIITFNSANATQEAIQALLRNIGYLNASDDPVGGTRTIQFQVSDGDGQTSALVSRPVNVIPVNDAPVVALPGGPINVTEGDAARNIDPTATVVDPDSHDFDGGTLTVFFPNGGSIGDRLAIEDQGVGIGQVGVVSATFEVTFGGTVIGTFTGGIDGTPLVITFNAASAPTPQSIQAVVRAITFQNISDDPPANTRPIRFVLTDGDGGTSPNVQVTATITPVNDAPLLTPTRTGFTYTENDAPTAIDAGLLLADPDSPNFNNGTLTVNYTAGGAAEDLLSVRNEGTALGQISVSGLNIAYNSSGTPTNFASITSSGVGTTQLQITFNPNAQQAAVQALLRNITYSNISDNPSTVQRTVRFVIHDGSGGFSDPVTWTIDITNVNDGPAIGGVGGTVPYEAGFPAVVLAPTATVNDPDSANYNTGSFTATIASGGFPGDVLAIRNQGTGAGRIGTSGTTVTYSGVPIGTFTSTGGATATLTVSLNSAATNAAVQALASNITFRTPNGVGITGLRVVSFSAIDFAGGAPSNIPTLIVDVSSNAGPNDDFYEINEDFPLNVAANGVLANDPSPAQLVVDSVPVSAPTKGSLNLGTDGSFQYVPNANVNGTDTFTYRWTNTVTSATGTAVVTIIIDPVNDAPTATFASPTITVNEDSAAFSQNGFAVIGPGGGTDEALQGVARSFSNTNPSMFASQPAIDATGRLTFTPAPNGNGTAVVTVTLKDDGGTFNNVLDQDTAQYTFTIVINSVNDIPTFQIQGNPPASLEDAGPQSVVGFAFNFQPGPATAADEASQTPTYLLTPIGTTGGLTFAATPSIDANGDLTYTATPNSNGTASFIVQVRDSGGTEFGGQDLSAARTFTITVTPVDDPPTALPVTTSVEWNTPPNPISLAAFISGAPDAGDTASVTAVTQGTQGGTVAIQPGGSGVTYQPLPGFVGTDTFTYTASDGQGNTATATVTVDVIRVNTQAVDIVALGSGVGGGSKVRIYNSKTGQFVAGFSAYSPDFQGGVSVATGDVNGDGVIDIVVGAGPGGGPHLMIVDGTRLGLLVGVDQIADPSALLQNFFVYDFNFRDGITVATGDVNGDGKADVIVGTGAGGGAHVKVISGALIDQLGLDGTPETSSLLANFIAYDVNFRGGVNVAAGDVNGDGFADVLTAAGVGGGSHVKAYNGFKLVQSGPNVPDILLASFYAFDPSFRGGVTVAAGDFDDDGFDEYIVGAGAGGGSHVKVFSPFNLATPIASFFAFGSDFGGGVNVGYRARSGGASPLLLAGTGVGVDARLLAFAPPDFAPVINIDAFDADFTGGVDVG